MTSLINKIRLWIVKFLLKHIRNRYAVYEIYLENKNEEKSKAIIFGYNRYAMAENFGSDKGVDITLPNATYQHLLCESQLQTNAKLIRVVGNSGRIRYKTLFYKHHTAFGIIRQKPFYLEFYYSPFQVHENILDIEEDLKIDGNAYLEIDLEPKEKLTLIISEKK